MIWVLGSGVKGGLREASVAEKMLRLRRWKPLPSSPSRPTKTTITDQPNRTKRTKSKITQHNQGV